MSVIAIADQNEQHEDMKDENMSTINKAWQLCVIDRSLSNFSNAPHFENLLKNDAKTSTMPDGTIVFVINSIIRPFSTLGSAFRDFNDNNNFPIYCALAGVPYAYIWIPAKECYGIMMQDLLHPILTEQDAVEMEFKFGIDLKMFI